MFDSFLHEIAATLRYADECLGETSRCFDVDRGELHAAGTSMRAGETSHHAEMCNSTHAGDTIGVNTAGNRERHEVRCPQSSSDIPAGAVLPAHHGLCHRFVIWPGLIRICLSAERRRRAILWNPDHAIEQWNMTSVCVCVRARVCVGVCVCLR